MTLAFSVASAVLTSSNTSMPIKLGTLQEVSLDFDINIKELRGQQRYPVMAVAADGKVSGKAGFGTFYPEALGILLGGTKSTGAYSVATLGGAGQTAKTIPTTPFAVTVSPPNSGTWAADGGVILVGASELFNTAMTRVASTATPTTGQYKVSAGVYTFAAADAGATIIITYQYTTSSGTTITVPNLVMGASYPFELIASATLQNKEVIFKLPNVISGKLSMPFKVGDFSIFDFDFEAFPDGSGNIAYIYTI